MSSEFVSESTHPDFPNGTEVINIATRSAFFGHRGKVYGSGPSKNNQSTSAVICVAWPGGERHSYFPNRLAHAPLNEGQYKIRTRTDVGKKITIHEIPISKRARPTIFELSEKKSRPTT